VARGESGLAAGGNPPGSSRDFPHASREFPWQGHRPLVSGLAHQGKKEGEKQRGVERSAAGSKDAATYRGELGAWLTSSRDSISLFLRHVKSFRILFAIFTPRPVCDFFLPLPFPLCSNLTRKSPAQVHCWPVHRLGSLKSPLSEKPDENCFVYCLVVPARRSDDPPFPIAFLCSHRPSWTSQRWNDGCRAEFVAGYDGGPGRPGDNWPGWGNNFNVYCASDDGRLNRCPVDTAAAFDWFIGAANPRASMEYPGDRTAGGSGWIAVAGQISKSANPDGSLIRQ
jgi:hypothetical protein